MLKQRQPGRRRKLYKFHQFINDFDYHAFKRGEVDGLRGYMYALDDPDWDILRGILYEYENTKAIIKGSYHAPGKTWLFIAD